MSYQLCPKCVGTGFVSSPGYSSSAFQTCDVCNGVKIIEEPNVQQLRTALAAKELECEGLKADVAAHNEGQLQDGLKITYLESRVAELERELEQVKARAGQSQYFIDGLADSVGTTVPVINAGPTYELVSAISSLKAEKEAAEQRVKELEREVQNLRIDIEAQRKARHIHYEARYAAEQRIQWLRYGLEKIAALKGFALKPWNGAKDIA